MEQDRADELYELKRNPKTRSITNMSSIEWYEHLNGQLNHLICKIENERQYISHIDRYQSGEVVNKDVAWAHHELLKFVKSNLVSDMTPAEYEMVLEQNLKVYKDEDLSESEVLNVKDFLKKLRKRMRKSVKEGGYELSESEQLMLRQVVVRGVEEVHKKKSEQIRMKEEIATLRQQVAQLTSQLAEVQEDGDSEDK